MENQLGTLVHPLMINILARKFSLSAQKCRKREAWHLGTQLVTCICYPYVYLFKLL